MRKLLIESSRKVLKAKAGEYASDTSRFHNFEVAGKLLETTPEEALLGMMSKHVVSVLDIIEKNEPVSKSFFVEKFGDAYNYSLLLIGVLTNNSNVLSELDTYQCHDIDDSINISFHTLGIMVKGNSGVSSKVLAVRVFKDTLMHYADKVEIKD